MLPAEYIQLDWIQSTGTQYIDTEVTGGSETYFEVEFIIYNPLSSSSSGAILGSRTAPGVQDYSLATYSPTRNLYMGVFYNIGITWDERNYIGVYNANLTTGIKQTCSYRNGIYTDPSGNTTIASLSEPYENQVNVYVFAKNDLDRNIADELGRVRLYYLKLWKGNNLVRNFIPCYRISDGEAGLYDTVNDVFYTNQGTGEFIKGPTVGWSGVTCPDILYLIKDGQPVNNEITGGWQTRGWADYYNQTAVAPTTTYNSNNIFIRQTGQTSAGVFETINNIDLSQYSTLKIDLDANTYAHYGLVGVYIADRTKTYLCTSTPSGCVKRVAVSRTNKDLDPNIITDSAARNIATIDVSDISDLYDIAVFELAYYDSNHGPFSASNPAVTEAHIYNLWLEK